MGFEQVLRRPIETAITNSPCISILTLSGQAIGGALSLTDAANEAIIIAVPDMSNLNFSYSFARSRSDFSIKKPRSAQLSPVKESNVSFPERPHCGCRCRNDGDFQLALIVRGGSILCRSRLNLRQWADGGSVPKSFRQDRIASHGTDNPNCFPSRSTPRYSPGAGKPPSVRANFLIDLGRLQFL